LAAGFLYALPNFYGESPAVQISSAKPTLKVDEDAVKSAEQALKSAGLAYDEAALKIAWLVREGLARKETGVALKDESGEGTARPIADYSRPM